jgi:PmbA protein
MSKDLLERAKAIVAGAQKRGAQGVRASAYRNRNSKLEWRDGKVDRLRESTSMGVSVSLYVDGRYSSNSSSDLRPDALDKFLDETVAMTKVLSADEHRKLPDPKRYADRFSGDLKLLDEAGAKAISGVDRRRTAKAMEEAARAAKGTAKIISVSTSSSDSKSEGAMVTSNGLEVAESRTTFVMFAKVSIQGEGDRKPGGYHYAVCRHRDALPTIELVGAEATRRTLEMLGEKPEKTGKYPCVIENRVVGRVLSGLLGPLSGSAIQQKRSFLADKLDQQVGSKALTIFDDPHVVGGLGSTTYDGEGMSTVKRPLFEAGVVKNFLFDTYYASKLGKTPTAGSTTNLVLPPGKRDLAALLAAMGDGILITGFSGGNSNAATGDFSVGIRGMWIKDGKPIKPVAEMNLGGNHLQTWKQLAELGSDVYTYSSTRSPSLRFEPLQFSGS